MGANSFSCTSYGKNANEAFNRAVDDALYEYGHGGYTGSIAEKSEFRWITKEVFESEAKACEFAEGLLDEDDDRISDKWGPAGCISFKSQDGIAYLFFGWASS